MGFLSKSPVKVLHRCDEEQLTENSLKIDLLQQIIYNIHETHLKYDADVKSLDWSHFIL